ncbi:MAG: hypothetical protein ACKV22_12020 [Bryobacteraceae bacterium]
MLPEVAHHLTHRGVNREPILIEDFDRHVYLELVAKHAKQVMCIGSPSRKKSIRWPRHSAKPTADMRSTPTPGSAFKATSGRTGSSHAGHRWVALRYVERNPVRARLVQAADQWLWSSAAVHVGQQRVPSWMSVEEWAKWFTPAEWQVWPDADGVAEAEQRLRSGTATGRPGDDEGFVLASEAALGRRLHPEKGGRSRKEETGSKTATATSGQQVLWAGRWSRTR